MCVTYVRTLALAVALLGCLCGGAVAEETEPRPAPLLVEGKLQTRHADRDDDSRQYFVQVRSTTYTLAGADDALRPLVHKMVAVRGVPTERAKDEIALAVEKKHVAVQGERQVLGTVEESLGGGTRYVVVAADRQYAVLRSHARKLKPFLGKHVVVKGSVVGAGDTAELVRVRSVERRLLRGEREPDSGAAALRGRWKGTITAEKVPDNVPIRRGKALPLEFETQDPAGELAAGRLMGLYDVKGVKLRKHKHRQRTVAFDLVYSFDTGGSFVVRIEGEYSADWKTLRGTWSASFLGSGVFSLTFQVASPPSPGPDTGH